jgi:protein tyrosine phosphatase
LHLKSHLGLSFFLSGPKENTIKDFWQMVWQEKVDIIVMVTKLEEERRVA